MKHIFATILALGLTTPVLADDITTRDELMVYLKETMPDGQQISQTHTVGDTLSIGNRYGDCMSRKTLDQLALPTYIAIRDGMITLEVTKEDTGYRIIGLSSPACEYLITDISSREFLRRGVTVSEGEPTSVTIPIVTQRVLGVEDANFQGHVSMNDTTCDVSFRAWFESTEPSSFANYYTKEFKQDRRYKNVFSKEFQTSTWCFEQHYDGSYRWKFWSRL